MAIEWKPEDVPRHAGPLLFDTSVAHYARIYNYWLGGKDNFAADRDAAEQAIRDFPGIVTSARANRGFLARAVRFLAADTGTRQFLDIGTGIPTETNTHEVAQFVAPQSRVAYVDNDPFVLSHARALLASRPEGEIACIEADLRDPQRVLDMAARLLDFTSPVAVLLLTILQHIDDEDEPYEIVASLMNAMPSGSYLVLSHPAKDMHGESMVRMGAHLNEVMADKITARDRTAVARFFKGLELVEPGLVPAPQWRPPHEAEAGSPAAVWAAVARKN